MEFGILHFTKEPKVQNIKIQKSLQELWNWEPNIVHSDFLFHAFTWSNAIIDRGVKQRRSRDCFWGDNNANQKNVSWDYDQLNQIQRNIIVSIFTSVINDTEAFF